jgi:TrmH family RNA methyltransferase
VAVGMSEPGNAGTLIRTADAMGADAVVFAGDCVDPYNGKCLRSSAGSIFSLPIVVDSDAPMAISSILASGAQVLATALDASVDIQSVDLSRRTAWLFGPEAHGLPADVSALASRQVSIPMRGSAESLNVAAAAAICLYESARAQS